eukprot:m.27042 g.27042  ORF g.27042 m.27042 type:complete len:235 (-) comp11744_c0_seq2:860-1564(-)
MVGMMRSGVLLAEAPPMDLMSRFAKPTLEDVFLQLCRTDNRADATVPAINDERNSESKPLLPVAQSQASNPTPTERLPQPKPGWAPNGTHLRSLVWKNVKRLSRNYGLLLFEFLLPAIQIIIFCLAIGGDPTGLNIAIVNQDVGAVPPTQLNVTNADWCKGSGQETRCFLSDAYLNELDTSIVNLKTVEVHIFFLPLVGCQSVCEAGIKLGDRCGSCTAWQGLGSAILCQQLQS